MSYCIRQTDPAVRDRQTTALTKAIVDSSATPKIKRKTYIILGHANEQAEKDRVVFQNTTYVTKEVSGYASKGIEIPLTKALYSLSGEYLEALYYPEILKNAFKIGEVLNSPYGIVRVHNPGDSVIDADFSLISNLDGAPLDSCPKGQLNTKTNFYTLASGVYDLEYLVNNPRKLYQCNSISKDAITYRNIRRFYRGAIYPSDEDLRAIFRVPWAPLPLKPNPSNEPELLRKYKNFTSPPKELPLSVLDIKLSELVNKLEKINGKDPIIIHNILCRGLLNPEAVRGNYGSEKQVAQRSNSGAREKAIRCVRPVLAPAMEVGYNIAAREAITKGDRRALIENLSLGANPNALDSAQKSLVAFADEKWDTQTVTTSQLYKGVPNIAEQLLKVLFIAGADVPQDFVAKAYQNLYRPDLIEIAILHLDKTNINNQLNGKNALEWATTNINKYDDVSQARNDIVRTISLLWNYADINIGDTLSTLFSAPVPGLTTVYYNIKIIIKKTTDASKGKIWSDNKTLYDKCQDLLQTPPAAGKDSFINELIKSAKYNAKTHIKRTNEYLAADEAAKNKLLDEAEKKAEKEATDMLTKDAAGVYPLCYPLIPDVKKRKNWPAAGGTRKRRSAARRTTRRR
jgi:hypothetical protein